MRKIFSVAALFVVSIVFACSVWAGDPPKVRMDGNIAKFPTEEKILDFNFSKFTYGKGVKDIPPEFKFMAGKWWRGRFVDGQEQGVLWYTFISEYENGKITFISSVDMSGGNQISRPRTLLCSPQGDGKFECLIKGAKEGSQMSFVRYRFYVRNGKPIFEINTFTAEFQEVGNIPEPITEKKHASAVEPAPIAPKQEPIAISDIPISEYQWIVGSWIGVIEEEKETRSLEITSVNEGMKAKYGITGKGMSSLKLNISGGNVFFETGAKSKVNLHKVSNSQMEGTFETSNGRTTKVTFIRK
jgi:hypothetical protein